MSNINEKTHEERSGAKLGMWLFLLTELFLFSGLFLVYSVLRYKNSADFHFAAGGLNVKLGAFYTVILLTSSLFMALSILAVKKGKKNFAVLNVIAVIAIGLLFLVVKFAEWKGKFAYGMYPGSEQLIEKSGGEAVFYALYFAMTGLHSLHVLAGIIVLSVMAVFISKNIITQNSWTKLENAGLYWHLVDVVWIFIFPLLYLIT